MIYFPGTVCSQYARGEVVGDLCDSLCGQADATPGKAGKTGETGETGGSISLDEPLKVDSCQSWHGGKEIVFSAFLGTKKVEKNKLRFPRYLTIIDSNSIKSCV